MCRLAPTNTAPIDPMDSYCLKSPCSKKKTIANQSCSFMKVFPPEVPTAGCFLFPYFPKAGNRTLHAFNPAWEKSRRKLRGRRPVENQGARSSLSVSNLSIRLAKQNPASHLSSYLLHSFLISKTWKWWKSSLISLLVLGQLFCYLTLQ